MTDVIRSVYTYIHVYVQNHVYNLQNYKYI